MNNKEDHIVGITGIIQNVYQKHQYKVKLSNNHTLFGTLNGKMIKNRIWCYVGDVVEIELSVYDLKKCRVIKRLT